MSGIEINANEQYVTDLKELYASALSHMDYVEKEVNAYKSNMTNFYKGHASEEIVPFVSNKLGEHLALVRVCYEMLDTHVDKTLETFKSADEESKKNIENTADDVSITTPSPTPTSDNTGTGNTEG